MKLDIDNPESMLSEWWANTSFSPGVHSAARGCSSSEAPAQTDDQNKLAMERHNLLVDSSAGRPVRV